MAIRESRLLHCVSPLVGKILLQKSFFTGDQNFFWLYARLSCKDVGDLIV